jgi:hypothetical protein
VSRAALASADVGKRVAPRRGRLGGLRRCALSQLAQIGEHPLAGRAAGVVAGVEVPRVLAADLDQPAFTPLEFLRQQVDLPVVGGQHWPTSHEHHPPAFLRVWDVSLDPELSSQSDANTPVTCVDADFHDP